MKTPGPILAVFLAAACAGGASDDPSPASGLTDDHQDAGGLDGSAADASRERTTVDRCFSPPCERSRLVPQPDLPFLEDMGEGYVRLMEAEWELAPHTEGYRCLRFTLPQDVLVGELAPQNPTGTHHVSMFAIEDSASQDGLSACDPSTSGPRRVGGSGAGTEPWRTPDGVALRLAKGHQLLMQLHLFNPSDDRLTGRSGMWVKTVEPDALEHELEVTIAGTLNLEVPPGRSTTRTTCIVPGDTNLWSIAPHMHQLGSHMQVTLIHEGAEDRVLVDSDFDFFHQDHQTLGPVPLAHGDRLEIACSYDNDRGRTVHYGDGTLDEMCFATLTVYPPVGYKSIDFCP